MELPRLRDSAPIYGMNTRDDPKNLTDGECVELVNAYPGNPPIPRKGCRHHKVLNTENFDFASHAVPFVTATGGRYSVLWIKSGTDYKLIKINLDTRIMTVLGMATGLTNPAFHLIHVFDYIYSVVDEDMYWEGSTRLSRHKIIELSDKAGADIVREMCINVAASVSAVTKITGTTFSDGYFSYAFTFIRHIAAEAFDSDGNPQEVTAYYPGVNEGIEDINNRKTVGGAGFFGVKIETNTFNENYVYATEQGATHIRIYRTRKQSDTSEATGATHFFLKDIPIPLILSQREIINIELLKEKATAFIRLHDFSDATALFFGNDSEDLNNTVMNVIELTPDKIELTDSEGRTYSVSEPGYATQSYEVIQSINLIQTNVRVVFKAAHYFNNDETVRITGVVGGDGSATGEKYQTLSGMVQSDPWLGVNTIEDDITVIDVVTIEFKNTLSAAYKKPFGSLYTEAQKTPVMSGGYAVKDWKEVQFFTLPDNRAIIETTTDGILEGYSITVKDVVGSTELNDNTYSIYEINGNYLTLDLDTYGITPYVSGGTILPASTPPETEDTITDAALSGETATLTITSYSEAPLAGLCEYAATRLYLFGLLTTEKGRAYYSEFPGGDGGTPLEAAHTFPQKFLSQYNYNYYMDFSVKKGFLPTGIKRLSNDLYFFFEGEIYALFGSDPTINVPSLISEDIGCAFPDTLIIGELPVYGGQCLLYLSNLGPAITMKGGETFLFTGFKVAELWPDKNRDLWDDLQNHRDHIITHCFSEYWDNTWWINYTTYAGVHKIWGHYFNPELKLNQKAPQGAFELRLAEV